MIYRSNVGDSHSNNGNSLLKSSSRTANLARNHEEPLTNRSSLCAHPSEVVGILHRHRANPNGPENVAELGTDDWDPYARRLEPPDAALLRDPHLETA